MPKKPLKLYKALSIAEATEKDAIYCIKANSQSEFTMVVTDMNGQVVPLKDLGGSSTGIQSLINDDGTIQVSGGVDKIIRVSPSLASIINSALQSGDPISSLLNDSGYLTVADLPTTFPPSAHTHPISDIVNLQSELNSKQPSLVSGTTIKTIEGQSLLGVGNIDLFKSDVGLSNVDNTSDLLKPISTATQNALDNKLNVSNPSATGTLTLQTDPSVLVGTFDILVRNPSTGSVAKVPETIYRKTGIDVPLTEITGLQTVLDTKANISGQVFTGAISATNLSGTNTGDETLSSIQTKRPLKTVNTQSLEGTGNIQIDYSDLTNIPTTFPPSAHTHPISDVTNLQTTLNGKMDKSVYDTTNSGIVDGAEGVVRLVFAQEAISKGDPVYVSTTGDPTFVLRARADTPSKMPAFGIAQENIASGTTGKVTVNGSIRGLDTSGYTLGKNLYVGLTGGLTSTKPTTNVQPIGVVLRTGGSDGVIAVEPQAIIEVDQTIIDGSTNAVAGNAVFDALTTKISGTGTTNRVSKWNSSTTQVDSNITDNGTIITTGTDITVNSQYIGRGAGNSDTNIILGTNPTNNTGLNSVYVGQLAGNANTSGGSNVAVGRTSLFNNTTGNFNTSLGTLAGRYISDGVTSLTVANNGLFLGWRSRPLADNSSNEIVIGSDAVGNGNNSFTLGNQLITKTIIRGRALFGTTTDNGVDIGQFNGTVSGSPATLSNQFITKAQLDAQKRRKDVTYFAANDIAQNTVLVGNFVCLLTKAYKIVEVSVVFGEQSMNINKTIPFEIKTIDTDSAAPTATLQYTANVNAVVGAIQNKMYTFTPNITLPTNKLLTVNTGAFTASTQILKNCLVTVTLEEI